MKYFLLFLTLFLISPHSLGKKNQQKQTTEKKRTTAAAVESNLDKMPTGAAILFYAGRNVPLEMMNHKKSLITRMNKYCDLSKDFKVVHTGTRFNATVVNKKTGNEDFEVRAYPSLYNDSAFVVCIKK